MPLDSYGSLTSYGSFGTKKDSINAAAEEKKSRLVAFNPSQIIDGDTFDPDTNTHNKNNIRINPVDDGNSLDSYETLHKGFTPDQKKMDKQIRAMSKLLGIQATEADVYAQGIKATDVAIASMLKGQKFTSEFGPVQPLVEIIDSGEVGQKGRNLGDVRNPITGETMSQAGNTPELNADYYSKYNHAQRNYDEAQVLHARDKENENAIISTDSINNNALAKIANTGINLATSMVAIEGEILQMPAEVLSSLATSNVSNEERSIIKSIRSKKEQNDSVDKFIASQHEGNSPAGLDAFIRDSKPKFLSEDMRYTPEEQEFLDTKGEIGFDANRSKFDILNSKVSFEETLDKYYIEPLDKAIGWVKSLTNRTEIQQGTDVAKETFAQGTRILSRGMASFDKGDNKAASLDMVTGIGKYLSGIPEAVVESPMAAVGVIVESLPEMKKLAKNIWFIGVSANKLAEESKKSFEVEHGRLPEGKELSVIYLASALSASLDKVGAHGTLDPLNKVKSLSEMSTKELRQNAIKEAGYAAKANQDRIAKETFDATAGVAKKALVGTGAVVGKVATSNLSKGVGKGLVSETPTEFLQGVLEEYAVKQDVSKLTYEDAYVGGVLGGVGGAGMGGLRPAGAVTASATIKAASAAGNAARVVKETISNNVPKSNVVNAVKTANKSGDYSKVADPTDTTRVNTVKALLDNTPADDATPEVKQAHLDAIQEQSQAMFDIAIANSKTQEELSKLTEEEGKAYTDNLNSVKELRTISKSLNDANDQNKKEAITALYTAARNKEVISAREVSKVFGSMLRTGTAEELEGIKETVKDLSPEQVIQLEGKIRTLKNSTGVADSIKNGNSADNDIGYIEHQLSVENAVRSGNQKTITNSLAKFGNFKNHMEGKVKFLNEALSIANTKGMEAANAFMAENTVYRQMDKNGVANKPYNSDKPAGIQALLAKVKPDARAVIAAYQESVNNAKAVAPVQEATAKPVEEPVSTLTPAFMASIPKVTDARLTKEVERLTTAVNSKTANNTSVANVKNMEEKLLFIKAEIAKRKATKPVTLSPEEIADNEYMARQEAEMSLLEDSNVTESSLADQSTDVVEEVAPATEAAAVTTVTEGVTTDTAFKTLLHSLINNSTKKYPKVLNMFGMVGEFSYSSFFKIKGKNTPLHTVSKIFGTKTTVSVLSAEEQVEFDKLKPKYVKFVALTNSLISPLKFKNPDDVNKAISLDPSLLLLNGSGQFPDEVMAAMFIVVNNWMGTIGRSTMTNTEEDIRAILGLEKDAYVSGTASETYGTVGIPKISLAEDLGKQITKALGITSVSKDIDGAALPTLQLALGLRALDAMVLHTDSENNNDALVETKVSPGERADAVDSSNLGKPSKNEDAPENTLDTAFISIAARKKQDPVTGIRLVVPALYSKEIRDHLLATPELFTKLIEVEGSSSIGYSWKPIAKAASIMKRTFQKIPKSAQEALATYQSRAYYRKDDNVKVFMALDKRQQLIALGYVEDIESTLYHTRWKAQENENNAIVRALEDFLEYNDAVDNALANNEEGAIYFKHEMWKNSRIGIVGSNMNPQSNKTARFLIGMKEWDSEITTPEHRALFAEAIAEATGINEDDLSDLYLGKATRQMGVEEQNNLLAMSNAIEAISSTLNLGIEPTNNQKQLIVDGLAAGGGKLHTLDALVAMTYYHPTEAFKTQLVAEADGKTNGVAISANQFAGDGTVEGLATQMARANVFSKGHETADQDTYKTIVTSYMEALSKMREGATDAQKELGDALNILIGDVGEIGKITSLGRNIAKPSTITTIYGASLEKLKVNFGVDVVAKLEERIAKHKDDTAELTIIQEAVNVAVGLDRNNAWLVNDKPVLTNQMPKVRDLANAFTDINGSAMASAIEGTFGYIMEGGNEITEAASIIFEVFSSVLYQLSQEAIITKKKAGKGNNLSVAEIEEIAKSIQHLMPIFNTADSKGFNEGVNTLKTSMTRQYGNEAYHVQIAYNAGTSKPVRNSEATNSSSGFASTIEYASPSKGAVVNQVHATDAVPILRTIAEHAVLGVHDAIIAGIGTIQESTLAMNTHFDNVMQEHRIRNSVVETLNRVTGSTDPKVVKALRLVEGKRAEKKTAKPINEFVADFITKTDSDNKVINEYNGTVTLSGQYGPTISALNKVKEETFTELSDKVLETQSEKIVTDLINSSKGSQQAGLNPNDYVSANNFKVNSNSIEQIFDNLALVGANNNLDSAEHTLKLKSILNNLISKVLTKIDSEVDLSYNAVTGVTQGAATRSKVVIDVTTGLPLDTSAMSPQEVYVHELVHVVTQYALDNDFLLRDTVRQLRDSVEGVITVKDFLTLDAAGNVVTTAGNTEQQERDAAQLRMDYIFGNAENQGTTTKRKSLITGKIVEDHTNDGLHEFLAFGLTNDKFKSILASDKVTAEISKSPKLWDKNPLVTIGNIFAKVLEFIRGKIVGINGLKADEQLTVLATRLAGLHERKRMMLFANFDAQAKVIEPAVQAMRKFITVPLYKLSKSAAVKGSRFKKVRQIGSIVEKLEHVSLDTFMKVTRDVAKNIGFTEKNLGIQLLRELRGKTADSKYLHHLLSAVKQGIDQAREETSSKLKTVLADKYGRVLTENEKASITKVMLKTDISILFNEGFTNIDEVTELLEDEAKLETRIADLTNDLITTYGDNGHFYTKHAESLGSIMATGKATQDESFLNAYLIANISGVKGKKAIGDVALAETKIDELATLHALLLTNVDQKATVAKVLKEESAKTTGENGVVFTLQVQRRLKLDSQNGLFSGKKALMVKGYTKEIFNPNIRFEVANEVDGKMWERQGYVKQKTSLNKDPDDKNNVETLHMYVLNDGRLATRVSTIASMINNTAKGTNLNTSLLQGGSENAYIESINNRTQLRHDLASTVLNQFSATNTNVSNKPAVLVPIRNEKGEVTDFRYMMDESTKDTILDKNNSFDQILGSMAADIEVKPKAVELNNRTVKEVHDAYVREFAKDPRGYTAISPTSADPEIREIYRLLPDEMKSEIKRVWGDQPMQVKSKHVRLIFGFKKFSITSLDKMWSDDVKANSTVVEQMGMYLAEKLNTSFVRTAENIHQDFIKYVKDVIVIKGFIVMKENIASNNVLLYMMGLSMKDIGTYQAEGIAGVLLYQKMHKEIFELELELKVNTTMASARRKNITSKISRLKAEITANPVTPLIDAGIFQTIMEDIDSEEDQYTYKGIIQDKVKGITDMIPQPIIDVAKQIVMSHDTKTYIALKNTTQFSDFVARYALHKHNTSKSNPERMTEEESLDDIEEIFINYDLPTGTALQYANDMGLIMFTKFWMRIQKIYLRILLKSPGRTLSILVGNDALLGIASIANSSLIFGNTPQLQNLFEHLSTAVETPGLNAIVDAGDIIL